MRVDIASARVQDAYFALVDVVTPRPIAWLTSLDAEGRVNLAPFSFFNVFGANPPVVVFSPTRWHDRSRKDTLQKVEAAGEFVLNAAVESLAEKINLSSAELPAGQSEVELTGLTLQPAIKVKPPWIAESPVHLECKVREILPVGDGPGSANLVIGEVVLIDIDDAVLDGTGRVDPRKLRTIARLGADWYCRSTDLFEMKRPK